MKIYRHISHLLPGVGLITAILVGAAGAQTNNLVKRTISLQECIEMALKSNLGLQIARIEPHKAELTLAGAYGAYDPTIGASYLHSYRKSIGFTDPVTGITSPPSEGITDSGSLSVGSKLPNGLNWSLGQNTPFSFAHQGGTIVDNYQGNAGLFLSLPVLRNGGIDADRYTILTAKLGVKQSEYSVRQSTLDLIQSVQNAYYDLIFAQENILVQQNALELAQRLVSDNSAKVKAGSLPPLDERQAESQAATTRASLITANQQLQVQENTLKNLILGDVRNWAEVSLQPSEPLVAVPQLYDRIESWRASLASRPELQAARLGVNIDDIAIRFRKNQLKPDLQLRGGYGHSSTRLNFDQTLNDVFLSDRFPNYQAGVTLSWTLGNRAAKASLATSRDNRMQDELRVKQLEQNILVEVDNAISQARSLFERVDATRQAKVYAEEAMAAEQKKLESGKSTSYTVLQFQRDLTQARSAEIQALADYNKALAEQARAEGTTLERLKIQLETK